MCADALNAMDGLRSSRRSPAEQDSALICKSRRLTTSKTAAKARDMSALPERDSLLYTARIHKHFRLRCGRSAVLTMDEWLCIQEWREAELPVECVLAGIDQAFEQNAIEISSLLHCVWTVQQVAIDRGLSQ
jgi:hypothetical protein